MVRFPATNGVGAIELLVENDPRQLVRQRQRPETRDPFGAKVAPTGRLPTEIVSITMFVAGSITETDPEPELVTYTNG